MLNKLRIPRAAAVASLSLIAVPALAETVTLDFDTPEYYVGQSINLVDDINFLPAGTVFAPANVTTFTGTQALRSPATCANATCTNNAYRMEIRFGDSLPFTNGWLYKPASRVSMRVGVNSTAQGCFPEGSTCAMYASVHAYDRDGNPAAAPQDVFLFDAFTAQTVPITREIVVNDPLSRIARVVLTYGKGTVSHDIGFPGEPQIDHLVVEFPDTPPTTGPLPAAPTIQITEPSGSRNAPYNVHLRGSVNVPGGITAFCYRLNQTLPSGAGCTNLNLLQGNNFDIVIPDQDLAPGANTLSVRVYDAYGQVASQNAAVNTLAPPPPVVTVAAPATNTWLNPAIANNLVGNVRTVGAIKGFCVRIDNTALPSAASCTQNTSAVNNSNPSYQPLPFVASLAAGSIPSGQHTFSLFAVDRWNQVGRTDLTLNTPTDLRVVAMEITQGIQTFGLPLNNTGSTPYSGVNLRQGVPTVVRVFANSAFAGSYTGVNMLLTGFQPAPGGGESSLGGLLPSSSPSPIRNGPLGVPTEMRHDPAGGFVFTLPNQWTGVNGLRLEAKLSLPFGLLECAGCATNNTFSVTNIGFGPATGVTISPVALTFTDPATMAFIAPGPPGPIFAPAGNIIPVPPASFVVRPYVGTIDVSSVIGAGGACRNMNTTCEDAIHGMVWNFNLSSPQPGNTIGVGAIDIGLDIPVLVRRPPFGQFEFGHIAIADTRAPMIAVAHEFMHSMGYFHASPCGGSDLFNMWPPDQQGFIHGVGLNRTPVPNPTTGIWNGQHNVLMPGTENLPGGRANYFDLMSYCASESSAWISVENWNSFGGPLPNGLIPDSLIFGTATATIKNGAGKSREAFETKQQVLHTIVVLDAGNRAVFTRVRRADGWLHEDPEPNEYTFVVRDAKLNEIARVPATVTMRHKGEETASSVSATGYLPADGAAVIELEVEGKVVARIERSRNTPKLEVSRLETEVVSRDDKVELRWGASDEDKDALEARIEFSAGPDDPFRSVYLGPSHGRWTIPGRLLSASDQARLRIVISDGFNEAELETEPFVVRAAPPQLEINGIADGASYPKSSPVRIQAAAFGDGQLPLDGKNIRWVVDGREAGDGPELELLYREPGKHFVQVYAREGKLESMREVMFLVHPNQ